MHTDPQRPTLLLHPGPLPAEVLTKALRARMPALDIRVWPDAGPADDIDYALVSRIEPGVLATLPRLRFVASLHAGVDHLLKDRSLAPSLPLLRPVSTHGDTLMNEYVLTQVLRHHRDMPHYASLQRAATWKRIEPRRAAERTVAVLGVGALGMPVAALLSQVGFDVEGWARRARPDSKFPVHTDRDGLRHLLARSEIVVNLLPLTAETNNLFDAALFALMPRGAALINVGRGEHVVDADLIAVLDSGQLSAATLDVFRREPLDEAHPFWTHPKVTITPHACRVVAVDELAAQTIENIERDRAGRDLIGLVDRAAGY